MSCAENGGCELKLVNGIPYMVVYNASTSSYVTTPVSGCSPLSVGQKHHIVGVFNGTSMKIYVNGELFSEIAFSGTYGGPRNNTVMALGANPRGVSAEAHFAKMKLYSAKIYDKAITAEEIEESYKQEWKKEHTVNLKITDAVSGLVEGTVVQYGWSESRTTAPTSWTNVSVQHVTGDKFAYFEATGSGISGKYHLWVRPVTLADRAGNTNTADYISEKEYWFDNQAPTWSTQNINKDETNKKVTVDLIGTDALSGYASDTLDVGDITVYVDGVEATTIRKTLSTATTIENGVKYTLTLSDWEEQARQTGKQYKEWSGDVTIKIAANTLVDNVGNTNIEDDYDLGFVDFIKPEIKYDYIEGDINTTTKKVQIVFSITDKYIAESTLTKEDLIILVDGELPGDTNGNGVIDGTETFALGRELTITEITDDVTGSVRYGETIGVQYTLTLSEFEQDAIATGKKYLDYSGIVTVGIPAGKVLDTEDNANPAKTLTVGINETGAIQNTPEGTGEKIDFVKPTWQLKNESGSLKLQATDKYFASTSLDESKIEIWVNGVKSTIADVTLGTATELKEDRDGDGIPESQYGVEIPIAIDLGLSTGYVDFTDIDTGIQSKYNESSGSAEIKILGETIVDQYNNKSEEQTFTIDSNDSNNPEVIYKTSETTIDPINNKITVVFDITDKYFSSSTLEASHLTAKIGETVITSKSFTSVVDLRTNIDGTPSIVGKRYTLVLEPGEKTGIVTIEVPAEKATDFAGNKNATQTITIGKDMPSETGQTARVVDLINPTVTVNPVKTTNAAGNDFVNSQNITINVADDYSGLASSNEYKYFLSTSETPTAVATGSSVSGTYTSGTQFTIGTGLTGTYYLFVKTVSDNEGNISTLNGEIVTVSGTKYHKFGPYKFDNELPTLTVTPESTTSPEWRNSALSVTITHNDTGGSGVASTSGEYFLTTNGTPTAVATGSTMKGTYTNGTAFSINPGTSGQYYLFVKQITDNATNISNTAEQVTIDGVKYHRYGLYKFDYDNPTLTVSPETSDWRNSALSVTITVTDPTVNGATSGVSSSNSYQWYLSNSSTSLASGDWTGDTWTTYTSGTAFDLNPGKSGTYYLFVKRVNDNAGNTSTSNGTDQTVDSVTYHRFGPYKFDYDRPTISVNTTSHTWTNTNVSVTITRNDTGGSGLSSSNSYQWYLSNSATELTTGDWTGDEWTNYTSGTAFNINPGKDGTYYLFIKRISDNAGNTSTSNGTDQLVGSETYHRYGTYQFDYTNPTITVDKTSNTWTNSAVSIKITAEDTGGSGLSSSNSYQWYLSTSSTSLTTGSWTGDTWTTYTSGTAFDLNPGKSGTYYLFVKRVNDNAGNTSTSNGTDKAVDSVTYHRYGTYQFDYDKPTWSYVSKDIYYSTANDAGNDSYANKDRTVKITFKGTDITTNITSTLTSDNIAVSVNGTAVANSQKSLTTTPDPTGTTKEVTCVLTVTGITGDGTLNVVIPAGTLTDQATNANDLKTLTTDVGITIDNTTPGLNFAVTSPTTGYYKAGQVITITATYNEDVYKEITSNNLIDTVAEAPAMAITFGGIDSKNSVTCSSVNGRVITYTYTIKGPTTATGTDGDNGRLVIKSLEAVYDAAGNATSASNVTPTTNITADTIAPKVTSITANKTSPTNAESITYTVVFSEDVTGFVESDVTVNSGKGTVTSVTGSGTTWNVIVSTTDNQEYNESITIKANGSSVDRAGNKVAEAKTSDAILVDRIDPTLTITANKTSPTNASSITYTFTFSEPVTGFDASDITITNGTKGAFNATSTTVYTLVVTNTGSCMQKVNVDANKCIDKAGNGNVAADEFSILIDRDKPTIAVTPAYHDWKNSALSVTITATDPTVNEVSSGLATTNSYQYCLLPTGTTPTATTTWSTYTSGTAVSLNPGTTGQYYLYVKPVSDKAGNISTTESYHRYGLYKFDYDIPTWSYVSKDIYYSTANDVGNDDYANKDRTVKITFKGTDITTNITSTLTSDNIVVSVNGTAVANSQKSLTTTPDPTGTTKEVTCVLTVTGITGDGILNVSIPAGTLTDQATNTNDLKTLTTDIGITIDNTNPTLSLAITSPAAGYYKAGQVVTITATYNEDVYKEITSNNLIDTIAEAPAMAITFGGADSKNSVTCSSVNGRVITYTYTIKGPTTVTGTDGDNGRLVIKSLGTVYDAAGNAISASNVTPTVNVTADTTAPKVTSITANRTSPTNAENITYTVVFSEAVTGFAASDVTVNSGKGTVTSVTGSGTTWSVVVSTVDNQGYDESITIKANGNVIDRAGNKIAEAKTSDAILVDRIDPTLTVNPSSADWKNSALNITITHNDEGGSGIASTNGEYFLSINVSPTSVPTGSTMKGTYTSGTAFNINPGTSGQYYLFVKQITDNATNISNTANQVTIDGTTYHRYGLYKFDYDRPTISVNTTSHTWTNTNVSVTITRNDTGGSGLSSSNSYQWYLSNSATELTTGDWTGDEWTNYTSGTAFNINPGRDGTYYLFIKRISDNAGNTSTSNGTDQIVGSETYHRYGTYQFDYTAPTWSTENFYKDTTNKQVTVDIVGTDNLSGFASASLDEDDITVYVDSETASNITKSLSTTTYYKADGNTTTNVTEAVKVKYTLTLSGFEKTKNAQGYKDWSGTVQIAIAANNLTDKAGNKNSATDPNNLHTVGFADFIRPDVNYVYATSDIDREHKEFTMTFDLVDKYFASSTLTNENLTQYLTILIDGENVTNNANVTKEITSVTDVTTTTSIKKTVSGTIQTVSNAVIGKRYVLKLSGLEQNPNDGMNYSGVISVAIKTDTVKDTSNNGNLVDTTTIKTGDLPSGGTPGDGTVDVVQPIWEYAGTATAKPANQIATLTIRGVDKFFASSSFDESDITIEVDGVVTTTGINVDVQEQTIDSSLTGQGKQYKVTITGYSKTASQLKATIDAGVLVDKSGNVSEEKEFILFTSLVKTASEGTGDSIFLSKNGGATIKRNQVERVIFQDNLNGMNSTKWDVSEVNDGSIMAWYTDSNSNGLYEVYIGSYVIINGNVDSSCLFNYIGYNESAVATNKDTNPIIENLDLVHFDSVTKMHRMFQNCGYYTMTSFSLGDNFNTESATDMSNMFSGLGNQALTALDLGDKFYTSNVTTMASMFYACGQKAMTSFDLGGNFDTSNVTIMNGMFQYCGEYVQTFDLGEYFDTDGVTEMYRMFEGFGYHGLTSFDIGDNFDTSDVTNMGRMFRTFGRKLLTSLDLGDKFYTTSATNMTEMFYGCGYYAMTSIDLGPAFTKIASTNTDFVNAETGLANCVIYAPSAIYSNMTAFRLNSSSSTTIAYARGTINPIYKPEWEKVSSTLTNDNNGTMTIVVKGSANEEFSIGNAITDPQKYLSNVTSSSNALTVYIDGEQASDVTASIAMGTPTLNETTGVKEITSTITIKNFAKAVRKTGKDFLEWSGNVSVQLAQGTLLDAYQNPNLANIGINTSGGMDRVEIEDSLIAQETSGKMFVDDIKPELTYKSSDTTINHGVAAADEYVTVTFDVIDKYFKEATFTYSDIVVSVDNENVSANITKELTKVQDLTYTTANGTVLTIGARYQLKITGLDKGDGATYSGPMSITIPSGKISDKTGNTNDATTTTFKVGVTTPDGTETEQIVDVVDPIWTTENININHTNKNVTVDLVGYDKYYASNSLDIGDITINIDGVDLTTTTTDVNVKKALSSATYYKADGSTTTNQSEAVKFRYTLTISNWQEAARQSGKNFLEWSGTTKIKIAAGTITDQYTNTSNETEWFTLGHVDFIKPEIVEIEPTAAIQAQDAANKTETIVFTVTDKYLNTTDMVTKDEILIYVDDVDVTSALKDDAELTSTAITGGYQYTLVIKNFEKARTIAYGGYKDYSGTVRIEVKAGAVKDTNTTPAANVNDLTSMTGDFVDYIKPEVNYIYSTSDINYGTKEFTMVFELVDKYFASSTLTNETLATYLTILLDGVDITTNANVTKQITSVTDVTKTINKTVSGTVQSVTNAVVGKRYTLKFSNLEQAVNDGINYSGVISVAIKSDTVKDTSNNANVVSTTTIKTGDLPSGGTPADGTVDVVDPIWEKVSTTAYAVGGTAEIKVRGIDKFLNDNTLTANEIEVWVNGAKNTSITPVVSSATASTATTVDYTITLSGFAQNVNQVKIKILEDAIKDKSGNGNKDTEIIAYNVLELTSAETGNTSGFLDGNGTNATGIARQDIEKVIFTNSISGASAAGVKKSWDVSAQNDGSIKAWTSQDSAPYTVYIGSDYEIFANNKSTYLFAHIGYSSSCTSTEVFENIELLNTASVTYMDYMFYRTGTNAMTSLDLGNNFDTRNAITMKKMFYRLGNNAMTTFDLGTKFNTSNVEDMQYMFYGCGSLALTELKLERPIDATGVTNIFDTSKVVNMEQMFSNCGLEKMATLDLGSNFNTEKVQNMSGMFGSCGKKLLTKLDLGSKFYTSQVTTMKGMFNSCGQNSLSQFIMGTNFNTSQVTDMSEMFYYFGRGQLQTLDLGGKFYTSNVTTMNSMFYRTGDSLMTKLDLGENFNTAKVTDMYRMFYGCGANNLTSLELGDQFYTTAATTMEGMFLQCGTTAMTTLDLGPAFTKIASTNTDIFVNTGKSGCVIYAPESIYSSRTAFKLNSTDTTTTIALANGTINPIYRPEWTKESSSISGQTISVVLKGNANKTQVLDTDALGNVKAQVNYSSTVTTTLTTDDIEVYINGVLDGDLNRNGVLDAGEASTITKTLTQPNPATGIATATHTLTLSNFEQTARQTGVPFKEWSGNISIKILGRGEATSTYTANILKDEYGNQSMMATDQTGTWIDVLYKDADSTTNTNTNNVMFTDFIKPEITYKYANTTINHDNKTVTVVFDVVDKYFNAVTTGFKAENLTVSVSDYTDAEVQAAIDKDLHLKTIAEDVTDATTGITYKTDGTIVYNGMTIGQRYELVIEDLEQNPNDGFKFSGNMSISIPADVITDKSSNKNNAKTITIGIDETDGNMNTNESGSSVVVDVVDPVWKVKDGTLSVTTVSGKTTATMTLIATDKYFKQSTLTKEQIQVLVHGVDISNIAPDAEITLSDPTEVENGVEYTFTVANLEETDATFFAERAKYAANPTTGRVFREFSGPTQILVPENTAEDLYGNFSEDLIVNLGTIDTLKPEVIKVSSQAVIDATNVENSKHIVVFDIVDKYFSSSAINGTALNADGTINNLANADTSKIHVLLDDEESTVTKTITNIQELRATVGTTPNQLVGYRYTLELSKFENPRTSVNFNREFTDWSGDLTIKVEANVAYDGSGTGNAETILAGNEGNTSNLDNADFVDYIKPDVTYQYTDSSQAVAGDINYGDKTFTMVFDITDKHFDTEDINANGVLDTGEDTNGNGELDDGANLLIGDLEILIDGEEPDWTKVTKSLAVVDRTNTVNGASKVIGKRYTLTLSHLEQLQIKSGDKYLDYSGVITVGIPAGKVTDTEGNGNDLTTITSGIDIPGGVASDSEIVDVVDPLVEKVSTSAYGIGQTAEIKLRVTDKYFNTDPANTDASTLSADEIEVYVNGSESSITPVLSEATPLNETRVVGGVNTTVQYGVEYTITLNGYAANINQIKIKVLDGAITDKSGNGNKDTEIIAYNVLELTSSEDAETDGFLDGNGANLTGIARQDIHQVIFTNSISGASASGVKKSWDVSAQNDGSIKAWTSQDSAPYTVYIGSDYEIFANQDSENLLKCIGYGESCTATETISGLNLLNTSSVTNMESMFSRFGYRSMTSLNLGTFDTSNVTNMSEMFNKCGYTAMTSLNLGKNFNTSNVTNMEYMFSECGYTKLSSLDLSSGEPSTNTTQFNTSSVTDMSYMFHACGRGTTDASGNIITAGITSLNLGTNFNTSNVISMMNMFRECGYTAMTSLDLSSGLASTNTTQFNTSSVTDMSGMFYGCGYKAMTSLNLGTNFNTGSVTTMANMFRSCGKRAMTTLDLSSGLASTNTTQFNTSNVTDMSNMFYECGRIAMTKLNLGHNFDTSSVTNMTWMFSQCGNNVMTSLDLGDKFDTTAVTDMSYMFYGCGETSMTTLDLGPAFTNIPTTNANMFKECGTSSLKVYAPESIYSDRTSFK